MEEIILYLILISGSAIFGVLRKWYFENPQAAVGVLSSYTGAMLVFGTMMLFESKPETWIDIINALIDIAQPINTVFILISFPFFLILGWGAGIVGWGQGVKLDDKNRILHVLAAGLGGFVIGLPLGLIVAIILALESGM